ncbi:hypothetical protein [Novosphingobium pentaromativorans]|uniref:hypothetical protein n=1 Tax=Novosphingobium pentaromativorans TaxID=205844 RepID=UPI000A6610B8|nr:hypothetical protein [Novosphingobium pentaromativorans]
MDDFYAARSNTTPPLPWSNFAPPFSIERMIARYPELEGEELNRTLSYLKREASAMDQAMIASNPDIMRQYRQLSRDHYLDRLRPSQLALATIVALVIVVALILAVILL